MTTIKFVKRVGFADKTGTEKVVFNPGQIVEVEVFEGPKYLIAGIGFIYPEEAWVVE